MNKSKYFDLFIVIDQRKGIELMFRYSNLPLPLQTKGVTIINCFMVDPTSPSLKIEIRMGYPTLPKHETQIRMGFTTLPKGEIQIRMG
jgi:hypothetical protein